jgi:hypothetical protein
MAETADIELCGFNSKLKTVDVDRKRKKIYTNSSIKQEKNGNVTKRFKMCNDSHHVY